MRKIARLDANHGEIVDTFRSLGCTVHSLAPLGNGAPDLLVGYAATNLLIEIKDPEKPPSKQALTPDQKRWHASWRGKVMIVRTREDVLDIVARCRGVLRRPLPVLLAK